MNVCIRAANRAVLCLFHLASLCDAFSRFPSIEQRKFKAPAMMKKADSKPWTPIVPKVVDFSYGPLVTEHGVEKSAFEEFFSKIESPSYCGYKWELVDNNVVIYDMVDVPHEEAAEAFNYMITQEAVLGGWGAYLRYLRSSRLKNPAPSGSNWEPDNAYLPTNRAGPIGSFDESARYPTMVLEVAISESDDHVVDKAQKYLDPKTTIQIVLVLLVRPKLEGADRLQVFKFERGQQNPCWRCSFADPVCTQPNDPAFRLPIPIRLLFENAPPPPALAGRTNIELDLFIWKTRMALN